MYIHVTLEEGREKQETWEEEKKTSDQEGPEDRRKMVKKNRRKGKTDGDLNDKWSFAVNESGHNNNSRCVSMWGETGESSPG